jgi:pectinacetylesterase
MRAKVMDLVRGSTPRKTASSLLLSVTATFGCSSVESTGDAGVARDGATRDVVEAGGPTTDRGAHDGAAIVAPNGTWTWVDFPDSKCASGTPTGMAINPYAGSTDLVIYLEGGGACYDASSCWGASPAATNLIGYDATTFAGSTQLKYAPLSRTNTGNPLREMNMVFIPYCTGDMHAGTTQKSFEVGGASKPTYFWGGNDMDAFLTRLVPTFAGTKRVWLFGTSAGGFGTLLNFDRVVRAFGVPVSIIDDSGPAILAERDGGTLSAFAPLAIWDVASPTGCSPCDSFPDIYAYDRMLQPDSRFALLSFAQDTVIAPDFGYTLAQYPSVIQAFTTGIAGDANAATFVVTNEQSHVVESDSSLEPESLPWLTEMVNGDPGWKSTTYAKP